MESQDPRNRVVQRGFWSNLLTGFAQCLKWLVVSLLFSIIVEWIGMTFWWEAQGIDHSQQMLANELSFLGTDVQHSLLTDNPTTYADSLSKWFHVLLFEYTRILELIEWLSPEPAPGEKGIRLVLRNLYWPMSEYVAAAVQITQVFAVRLAILTLASPAFGLFALVALVDGLVRRDLRRWGGGRESSFVYHYAKKAAFPLIISAWVIYLALPVSIHPSWVILPFSIGFAFTVSVTASTFKKYL
ncbi:TIGR03747 family integrating conjugative element membrane protein [Pseudomaricurvus alkylphenolicus]|uniref:TIGR03747 family integrating conjugative element membrane protein n=1 Tax=Pseudomaricurvus alkylphenolicus TaxID=1306991 RepID=UPI0014204EEB|nr:TIGR03747 family integrating conjugative element membrane protein [Pseudomaricurvus alkylphenolicus]